jgi:hypothetical protein
MKKKVNAVVPFGTTNSMGNQPGDPNTFTPITLTTVDSETEINGGAKARHIYAGSVLENNNKPNRLSTLEANISTLIGGNTNDMKNSRNTSGATSAIQNASMTSTAPPQLKQGASSFVVASVRSATIGVALLNNG